MRHRLRGAAVAAATAAGAVGFLGLLRDDGGAVDGIYIEHVEIVDRCGDVVRNPNGDPVVVELQIGPPTERVSDGNVSAGMPSAEVEVVAVAVPADIRQVTDLTC